MFHMLVEKRCCLAGALLVMVMGAAANAQNNFNLEALNPGEILVNLSAVEQAEVEQDTLNVQLNYITQGQDRIDLQDEVNRVMAEALELLEDGEVEYATQGYQVYPNQSGRPTRGGTGITSWRAQQGVSLSSQDSDAVLNLMAELQGIGLSVGGMYYSLSPERQEEVADGLMDAALAKLRARAQAAAESMGKREAEIIEISMNSNNSGGYFGRASTMAMSSAAEVATPVAEPGMTTVMFNVSARAILLP
jgi:predicted secreted protein